MNYKEYTDLFDKIVSGEVRTAPYDDDNFLNYTTLNQRRSLRWDKKGEISAKLIELLKDAEEQDWILITEPWCGDAAHVVPFIAKMAEESGNINLDIQLRDSEPFLIDQYLTNGGKSIPILIARNKSGEDLFVWGPRPKEAQALMLSNKKSDLTNEEQKMALQAWYNKDKGLTINNEFTANLESLVSKVAN